MRRSTIPLGIAEMSLKKLEELQENLRGHTGRKEKLDAFRLSRRSNTCPNSINSHNERAKAEYDDFTDIDQKRMKISLNKKSIEELGPVNLGAIEEFDRVNERYEFLKAQEADLLKRVKRCLRSLLKWMRQWYCASKMRFDRGQCTPGNVFKEMFGGGQAELRLTNRATIWSPVSRFLHSRPARNCRRFPALGRGACTHGHQPSGSAY